MKILVELLTIKVENLVEKLLSKSGLWFNYNDKSSDFDPWLQDHVASRVYRHSVKNPHEKYTIIGYITNLTSN